MLTEVKMLHFVEDMVNKLLKILSRPFTINQEKVYISASIGVSIYPDDGTDIDTLIRNADGAMYRAKEIGRNNVQFFTIELNEQAKRRRVLENALRQAIEKEELALNYQPIIDVENEQIIGAEALLRWNNLELGSVSPVEFIPLAEDTGLIIPIGEWISYTACKAAFSWQKIAPKPLKVAINLSSRQFQQGDVVFLIRYSLEKSGLAPEQLTVEITES